MAVLFGLAGYVVGAYVLGVGTLGMLGRPRPETLAERAVAALVGLVVVVVSFLFSVQRLNREWKEQQSADAMPAPTATPLIRVAILPGGHKPPTTEGGEAEPIGPVPKVAIPTPGPRSPTRLIIPAINIDVPVVEAQDPN